MNDELLYSEQKLNKLYHDLLYQNVQISNEGIVSTIVKYFKMFIDFIKNIYNKYFGYARRILLFCKVCFSRYLTSVKNLYKNNNNPIIRIPKITSISTMDALGAFTKTCIENSIEFIDSFNSNKLPKLIEHTSLFDRESGYCNFYFNFLIKRDGKNFIYDKEECARYVDHSQTDALVKRDAWIEHLYKFKYLYPDELHVNGGGDVPFQPESISKWDENVQKGNKKICFSQVRSVEYILENLEDTIKLFTENKLKIDKSVKNMELLLSDPDNIAGYGYTVDNIQLLTSYIASSMALTKDYLNISKNFFSNLVRMEIETA